RSRAGLSRKQWDALAWVLPRDGEAQKSKGEVSCALLGCSSPPWLLHCLAPLLKCPMVSLPIRSSSAVPRNLEIKVRVADLAPARATAARLGARPAGVEVQVDRYYELEGRSRRRSASARSTSSAPRTRSCSARADNTTRAAGRRRARRGRVPREAGREDSARGGSSGLLFASRAPPSRLWPSGRRLYPAPHRRSVPE